MPQVLMVKLAKLAAALDLDLPQCLLRHCEQTVTGRRISVEQATEIIEEEEYLGMLFINSFAFPLLYYEHMMYFFQLVPQCC